MNVRPNDRHTRRWARLAASAALAVVLGVVAACASPSAPQVEQARADQRLRNARRDEAAHQGWPRRAGHDPEHLAGAARTVAGWLRRRAEGDQRSHLGQLSSLPQLGADRRPVRRDAGRRGARDGGAGLRWADVWHAGERSAAARRAGHRGATRRLLRRGDRRLPRRQGRATLCAVGDAEAARRVWRTPSAACSGWIRAPRCIPAWRWRPRAPMARTTA